MLKRMPSPIDELKSKLYEVDALNMAVALMDWDQQTYMPSGGADARAEHVAILSERAHALFTSDETRRAIDNAKTSGVAEESDEAALLRVVERDFEIETKLPGDLVAERARLSTQGHEVWAKARADSDFKAFQPILERTVDLSRKIAECLGYEDHPYDALTDQYEEGASKKFWDDMFGSIREPISDLVAQIKESPNQPDDKFLYGTWDEDRQREFSLKLINAIGFRLNRGRLDVAPHPFCTGFSVKDVRLTTRYLDYLPSAIFGSLHEAGHGLYEQGSPDAWDRTPLAGGVSLGWHESQSRTWENIVGRSKAFWKFFYPDLQSTFPELQSVDLDTFYRSVNKSEPSFIRVEADEVTYNLHVLVRFEMETGMLDGSIAIKDVPAEWNARYEKYLGITPPDDRRGCLQDVHWSGGMLGYFPTYSMGNILSYQVWEVLEKDLGDVNALMESGNFAPILEWLESNIYRHGKKYQPQELLRRVTGGGLDATPYLNRIRQKYTEIYQL